MKKFISLLLSLALVICCVSPVCAASTATSAEIQVLTDLGIVKGYEDGSFRPDDVITRAEVVAIINRVQGLSDAAKAASGVSIYSDVKATDWFAGDVNLATQMGIISGDGDGTFRPNDQVKYEEAVKMVVAALGYNKEYVMKQGGWPTGYLVIATQAEVTKGLSVAAGDPAYRGVVAKLVYQALTAPMMVLSTYDDDGKATYKADPNSTLLGKKLNFAKVTGFVSANNVSALSGSETDATNTVRLMYNKVVGNKDILDTNKKEFITNTDYALGHIYDFYIAEDDNKLYIVSAEEGKNETITLVENEEYVITSKDNTITVEDLDGKEEDYELSDTYKALVNGKVDTLPTEFDSDDVVELIDVDNDNEYDYVFITKYVIGVVDSIYGNNKKISFKNISRIIDMTKYLEEEDYSYSIVINGTKRVYDISDLMEYDVLTIIESDKSIDITVSRNTVDGEVDSVNDADKIYYINGEEYKVSTAQGIELGLEGTFYLDTFGKIAWYKGFTSYSGNLGYVAGKGPITKLGETYYEILILTKNGKFETYTLSDKVDETEVSKYDLISYKTKDGKISSIEVLNKVDNPEYSEIGSVKYNASVNAFDGRYGIDESTIIFFVDKEADIDDYTVGNIYSLADEKFYDITIVEKDKYTNNATIVIINNIVGGIADNAPLAVLVNNKTVQYNDEVVNALTFLSEGKEITLYTSVDYDGALPVRGEVFEYSTNEDGDIDIINININTETIVDNKIVDVNAEIVEDKVGNVITLADSGKVNISKIENIYLVDLDKSKIVPEIGAIGDIIKSRESEGDVCVKAYIKYVDEKPFEMVVYFKTND